MVIDVIGTMISLMVLAVGFQLSSIYAPPVTVEESAATNNTTSPCPFYMYDYYYILSDYFVNR